MSTADSCNDFPPPISQENVSLINVSYMNMTTYVCTEGALNIANYMTGSLHKISLFANFQAKCPRI